MKFNWGILPLNPDGVILGQIDCEGREIGNDLFVSQHKSALWGQDSVERTVLRKPVL